LRGLLALVVSDPILREYERVLREVKADQGFNTDLEPWLAALHGSTARVTPEPLGRRVCRDPRDDMFIEDALAGGAPADRAQGHDLRRESLGAAAAIPQCGRHARAFPQQRHGDGRADRSAKLRHD
jgi:hypothetical protein